MVDRVHIKLPQVPGIGVRIREGLEIDDELVRLETFPNVLNSVADLIADGICLDCGRWTKRVVVAVGAAADSYFSVAVGTGEAGIDDDFVDALTELFLEPLVIASKAF